MNRNERCRVRKGLTQLGDQEPSTTLDITVFSYFPQVTGNAGERQVVATVRKYTKRPTYIVKAIADLVELHRDHLIRNASTVIEASLKTLTVWTSNCV